MRTDIEAQKPRTPIVKRAAAGLVLVVVAALAIKLVIGLITSIFVIVVVVAAIAAVLWALKTI
jgi:hypothetical protein